MESLLESLVLLCNNPTTRGTSADNSLTGFIII